MLTGPVLLVEDQDDVRLWLADTLRAWSPAPTVLTAVGVTDALAQAGQQPDIRLCLVDLGLPDGSGIELISQLSTLLPQATIVVTTVYADDAHVFPALAAGAHGYLLKQQGPELLRWQLAGLGRGMPALSPSIARRVLEYFRQRPALLPATAGSSVQLSPRETQVLASIGRGLRAGEVARQLGLSESTVVTYVRGIYRKLNISSRAEAAIEASRRGLA